MMLEDLKPFQHPDQALRDCQESLSNSDWCVLCSNGACVYVHVYMCMCVCVCVYACV